MGRTRLTGVSIAALGMIVIVGGTAAKEPEEDWIDLFNGQDLDNWTVKIRQYEPGENFAEQHCIPSSSPTIDGDQWVEMEVLVLGGKRIVHYVNGEAVIEYTDTSYGGGVVSGHRPEAKPAEQPLREGHIALQSESHPIQFRNIRLLNLKGCMDPEDEHYRNYFVADDPASCASGD